MPTESLLFPAVVAPLRDLGPRIPCGSTDYTGMLLAAIF